MKDKKFWLLSIAITVVLVALTFLLLKFITSSIACFPPYIWGFSIGLLSCVMIIFLIKKMKDKKNWLLFIAITVVLVAFIVLLLILMLVETNKERSFSYIRGASIGVLFVVLILLFRYLGK